ncbi:MAG: methyltransferase domain-containing protein [Actinobacteria bacterium]|nr:methyltransferase domain-containing protein [Actinomycetota bacterium]
MRAAERRYYDRRAPEYDEWWSGFGLFVERDRPGWHDEVGELERVLSALPAGRILDVACGTGFLTQHLPGDVTGLDQSAAMLGVARSRCPEVRFVQGDALALPFDDRSFDLVFTGHFYGHLRETDRERFLTEARRVAPVLVVADSAYRHGVAAEEDQERVLNDGSRYTIYKRYLTPAGLAAELGGGETLMDGEWFVVVQA